MTIQTAIAPVSERTSDTDMVLIFRLSGEIFALSVSHVHEILDPIGITQVPNATEFAPALVNVRGSIVPLINIRQRLRMAEVRQGATSRLIVLELPVGDVATKLAIMTDSVEEVLEVDASDLEPVPDLGARWPEQYVEGVARRGDDLVILLNTDALFCPDTEQASKP